MVEHSARRVSWLVVFLLCSPLVASTARKLAPGQPVWIELLPVPLLWTAMLIYFSELRACWRRLTWLIVPYLCVTGLYAVAAFREDWRIGLVAFASRTAPIFACTLGLLLIEDEGKLRKLAAITSMFAVATLPFAIIVAIAGNSAVPDFLQPIYQMQEIGADLRMGLPIFAGTFATPAVASLAFLAILSLQLMMWSRARETGGSHWWHIIGAVASLIIIYCTIRRGAFYCAATMFAVFGVIMQKGTLQRVAVVLSLIAVVFITRQIDAGTAIDSSEGISRSEAMTGFLEIEQRFTEILLPFVEYQVQENPFGTYLGALGPEGFAFRGVTWVETNAVSPVEVGAAMVIGELGVLGFFVTVLLYSGVIWTAARAASKSVAILPITLFQVLFIGMFLLKESSAMTAPYLHHIWLFAGFGIATGVLLRRGSASRRLRHR